MTLEPRAIMAEFDPRLRQLTVHHSHQVPHQMREIFAAQLGLPLAEVRVVAPDVGGAFGMKLSAYPDEMAVAAIAVLLGRPVKFTADRLESFVSDIHAREARVHGRLAVDAEGRLLAMDVSVGLRLRRLRELSARQRRRRACRRCTCRPRPTGWRIFAASARGYFQNKPPSGVLRGVGQPIA